MTDEKSARVEVTIPDHEIERVARLLRERVADLTEVSRDAVDAERRRVRHETIATLVKGIFATGDTAQITPTRLVEADGLMRAGADVDAVWTRLIEGAPL